MAAQWQGFSLQQVNSTVKVVLLLGFAAWCVQLGGIAALQQACSGELPTELNDIEVIKGYMIDARNSATLLATTPVNTPSQNLLIARTFQSVLLAVRGLESRSAMTAFSFESDYDCSMIYRYSWFTTAVQVFIYVLVSVSLVTKALPVTRHALCAILIVPTMLAISNSHGLLTLKDVVPELTLLRGKVFFSGCVIVGTLNCILVLVMGALGHDTERRGSQSGSDLESDTPHKADIESHTAAK